ncbi:MAG: chromosome segregation protein SMC [Saprospiraceae bacterium]
MRLKSLEIKGFKSFAEETVINFSEDVIGVVGPNGSGKSNVVDAIRWVLGEQRSKELRLDKMLSVIFNGTKTRKEGSNAQVTLTFENTKNILPTEYHTVSITRILYRSGESEYRLNGVTCRLKDITTLLLDTGIGSNSYAIIALGMVDDILENKENARRRMFEQAAGISKYKARKHETMQKLDATSQDLERVQDLLFEIEKNLDSLEKQAKRTQKFFDLREKYKELSIALAVIRVNSYKASYKEISAQIEREEDQYRQIQTSIVLAEAALEKEKAAHVDKEKNLSEKQRELNSLVGMIRGKENDKRMLEQKTEFVLQNKKTLSEQMSSINARLQQIETEIERYSTELNGEKRIEAKLEEVLEIAENKLKDIRQNHGSMKSEIDQKLNLQQNLEREVTEFDKRKAINLNQIDNLSKDVERRIADVQQRRLETENVKIILREVETKELKISAHIQDLETKENTRKTDVEKAERLLDEKSKQLSEANRKLDSKKNEFKLTKSMVESLEGFPESIKFLQSNKDWKFPLLSDLFYVKENYRAAIENYLEPYLNYYVVDTYDDALKAIRLLSNTQKGKANFFILEAFSNYQPVLELVGSAEIASNFIEVEAKYRVLTAFLMENVFVSDTVGIGLSAALDKNITLIDQSGAFMKRRFSISGGSVGLFEGKKIGRKKNLEILEKLIKEGEEDSAKFSAELVQTKAYLQELKAGNFTQEIQSQYHILNKNSQEKLGLQLKLDNVDNYAKENEEKNAGSRQQIESIIAHNLELDAKLSDLRGKLEQLKNQVTDSGDTYRLLADELSATSQAFNEANINFIRQQNKVNTLQQELNFRNNQSNDSKLQLQRNESDLKNSEIQLLENQEQMDIFTRNLKDAYIQRKSFEADLSQAEQTYYQARTAINELDESVRKLSKRQSELQSLINNLKDKFNDIKIKLSAIGERLQVEFNIGINDVINQEPDDQYNPAQLEEDVTKMKRQLDTFGEINPMAVEAYNEIKERHDTIAAQRDDILAAKDSLMETIKEIEETATEQFRISFDQIRTNFIEIFRTLFTEDDSCDLTLENPDNPLESPINIIAKPKGKRPQSIAQLSGGEKTLTATALLFALYLLKPAPFCIFDEVDAPLDDANIEKFNKIIKKFSTESQFIIVTHNKATMAAVDVIYGVYMPEQGVSAVTPVDFRSLDDNRGYVNAVG